MEVVNKGHILGIEDVIFETNEFHCTTATVHSVENGAEIYKIDKELFCNLIRGT
jgi:hypothetical protein